MMKLTKQEIEFIQFVLSRAPFTGVPDALAQYLETYVQIMHKLEKIKNLGDDTNGPACNPLEGLTEQEKEDYEHLEGVGA